MRSLLCLALFASPLACETGGCHDITSDVGQLCLPASLAAGQETTIEIRELCGAGCSHPPGCTALLRNGVIELDVRQEICSEAQFFNCVSISCIQRVTRCKLPSLSAGDYTVVAPGAPRQLVHVVAGGDASCRFPLLADGGS